MIWNSWNWRPSKEEAILLSRFVHPRCLNISKSYSRILFWSILCHPILLHTHQSSSPFSSGTTSMYIYNIYIYIIVYLSYSLIYIMIDWEPHIYIYIYMYIIDNHTYTYTHIYIYTSIIYHLYINYHIMSPTFGTCRQLPCAASSGGFVVETSPSPRRDWEMTMTWW